MKAATWYGILLGLLFVTLDALGSRAAWACYWGIQAVLLAVYTKLTWQRTRLFWMAEGGAHATAVSAAFVPTSLAGYTLRNLSFPWQVILGINVAALVLSQFIARSVHRDQFDQWKQHMERMERMSLRDMLRFRHIPHLR